MKKLMQVGVLSSAAMWAMTGVATVQAITLKGTLAASALITLGLSLEAVTGPLSAVLNSLGAFLITAGCSIDPTNVNCTITTP